MWIKTQDGALVNLAACAVVEVEVVYPEPAAVAKQFRVRAVFGNNGHHLATARTVDSACALIEAIAMGIYAERRVFHIGAMLDEPRAKAE